METADVVIIGAGIVGSSIAYHLTAAGCTNVLILERETHQGKGSTGKSMGGVRAQFSTPVSIQMSLYSIPFYAEFEEYTGYEAGYRPQGYLFLATSQQQFEYLRANADTQRALGVRDVCLLSADEIRRQYPLLAGDDLVGGSFCATDGFVDPHSTMSGFMKRARERGARLWREAEVTGICVKGGRVVGVQTTRGPVETRTLVNAAGPWAASVARFAGVELPVKPLRRMLLPSEPFEQYPHTAPMTIDMATGFHFRPESRGFLLAWNDPEEQSSFRTDFDPDFVEKVLTQAANRVPIFENLPVNPQKGWAGLYEMTPDHHPILGAAPGVEGLYFANGFSGHGVMHAPATGRIMADLVLKGETDLIDASLLNLERFQAGRLVEETAVL
jgi:sarcosine oxidase subunit beta